MKLKHLIVDSFLGIRHAEMQIGDVTIFAGDNWAGKSSLQQAIRVALSGEVARVKLKGEYGLLVKDGSKRASIAAEVTDGDGLTLTNSVDIPVKGKATIPNCDSQIVKVCLDQEIIPNLAATDEKSLLPILFTATNFVMDTEKIGKRMLELGADAKAVEEVGFYLHGGFDSGRAFAQEQTKAFRAEWKAITGQTYGSEKAESWKHEASTEDLQKQVDALPELEKSLKKLRQELWSQQSVVSKARLDWESATNEYTCSKCGHSHKADAVVADELHDKYLAELGGSEFIQTQIDATIKSIEQGEAAIASMEKLASDADKVTESAKLAHQNVGKWAKIEELLSPEGIMQEILSESLQPINERLKYSANVSGLGQVAITPELSITYENRLYGLCSEAQKWVAQAMLTEAIAYLSGVRLVALDRFDVLSVTNRGKFIGWCKTLSVDTQFVLFGTLKSKPSLDGIASYWIENGEIS